MSADIIDFRQWEAAPLDELAAAELVWFIEDLRAVVGDHVAHLPGRFIAYAMALCLLHDLPPDELPDDLIALIKALEAWRPAAGPAVR